jgi:chromosome segregation protein
LGDYADGILLESGRDAEQALLLLDSDQSGRASLLPLDWLSPTEPLKIKRNDDCLGVASDLVKTSAEYRPALDLLLGQVLIVVDRAAARRILTGLPKNTLAVTLHGEVFHASGQVSAGKPSKVAALGRPRLRRELQESLKEVENQIARLGAVSQKLSGQIETAREYAAQRQDIVGNRSAALELARNNERQAQVRKESTQQNWDFQLNQNESIESEIAQTEMERKQTIIALSADEKAATQAQETLRTQSASMAAISMDEYQAQFQFWTTSSAVSKRVLSDAQARQLERKSEVDRLKEQLASEENHLVEIEKSLTELGNTRENLYIQASGINTQLEDLRLLIEPAEKELETSEALEMDLQKQETEEQFSLARFERTNNQIQLELSRKQETLETLRQKIEDDFGLVDFEYASDVSGPVPLPFVGMVEQLPPVKELPVDLEENMVRLRAQLRRMGAINPEAQAEYLSVKERHAFLTAQLEDLHKAEIDLHQVIAELDELTRREFQRTFEAVAEQFHEIFHRLFGGGAARLVLTDPENLTETGIEIEARLPGRREQGLALLSGGERSLTAIALVFSLLKVAPTPVCVLDEVDAMLDEANVGRFRDLLLELSKETQFIIITHNRNTVQAADVIYGVTMGRDSASQIISLKLDEISEEYLK